jgi:predicted Ser/Thr protein kinase
MRAGTLLAGRFELGELAGRGGMGAVYRALDRTTGEAVAVKVLRDAEPETRERFAREARTLAALSHPGIVRYVSQGLTDEGEPFLVMEWVEGEELGRRLKRGNLSPGESVRLVGALAEALGAAHRCGVIHRDLKPTNVLLVGSELARPKLLDFGIARGGEGERALTMTGVVLGTPGYLSPEQARGERDVDARADVFALGCLLFRCLTGRLPFVADEPVAALLKVVLEEPPRVRELSPRVSPELDAFVARMLAKRRADRPDDGSAVAEALALFDEPEDPTHGGLSRPSAALTGVEQRSLCLLLVRLAAPPEAPSTFTTLGADPDSIAPTRRTDSAAIEPVRRLLAPFGGRLDVLADGSLLVTFASGSALADDVRAAARAALALSARLGPLPMALATGRGVVAGRLAVGSVVDRAVTLLARGPGIHVDPGARELLELGFEVTPSGLLTGQRGEPEEHEGVRTLLGRPTPCVGRERDLAILQGYFEECASDSLSRCVLVTAAAGFGKSRLRHELVASLRRRGEPFELWVGRGDPASAGAPFGILADALGRAAGLRDGEPRALRYERLRDRVERNLRGNDAERVTLFLGELLGAAPSQGGIELAVARRDAMLMGDRLRRAFEDFVAAECARQPLVLVLEDLHWGDRSSIELVDGALAALPDSPFFVVGFARPGGARRASRVCSPSATSTSCASRRCRRARRRSSCAACSATTWATSA